MNTGQSTLSTIVLFLAGVALGVWIFHNWGAP